MTNPIPTEDIRAFFDRLGERIKNSEFKNPISSGELIDIFIFELNHSTDDLQHQALFDLAKWYCIKSQIVELYDNSDDAIERAMRDGGTVAQVGDYWVWRK